MAGICGNVHFGGGPVDPDGARRMLEMLELRGAGAARRLDRGGVFLGSIGADAGHADSPAKPPAEPASNGRGLWAVVEGCLTNAAASREQLRGRGRRLSSESPAEIVVALYEQHGDRLAERLEGAFSLAVWDETEQRLLLARDRFGIKPLYYALTAGGVAFSSRMEALPHCGVSAEIDPQAVDDYLWLGYVPQPGSIYQGIHKLPHAHTLSLAAGSEPRLRRYWDVLDGLDSPEHEAADDPLRREEAVWDLFRASVKRMAAPAADTGVFLSGGPDSAAVVAALDESGTHGFPTFTIGFRDPGFDESPWAKMTAERYTTRHHGLSLDDDAGEQLPRCLACFDEPYAHPSAIAIFHLSRMAASQVKVALGGDAADGLFGGASTYQASNYFAAYRRLPAFLSRGLIPALVRSLPVSHSRGGFEYLAKRFVAAAGMGFEQAHLEWMKVLSDRLMDGVRGPALTEVRQPLSPFRFYERLFERARRLDRLTQLMYVDLNLFLPGDILVKVDRLSAAHGLDFRPPFLDRRLVEFAFRLPSGVKIRGRERKYLLRRILRDKAPREVTYQKKIGFISPASSWLSGGMRELLRDTLGSAAVRESGFFNNAYVEQMIEEHETKKFDRGRPLWSLLAFGLWLERSRKERAPAGGRP